MSVRARVAVAAALILSWTATWPAQSNDDLTRLVEAGGPVDPAPRLDRDASPDAAAPESSAFGGPLQRPVRPAEPAALPPAAVSEQLVNVPFVTLSDLMSWDRTSVLAAVGVPVPAGSHTLADILRDRTWRRRTSRYLDRLFQ